MYINYTIKPIFYFTTLDYRSFNEGPAGPRIKDLRLLC